MEEHKYQMHIQVPSAKEKPIFQAQRVTLRDRLLTRLFGKRQQYVVIMPSSMVDSISLEPVRGGEAE